MQDLFDSNIVGADPTYLAIRDYAEREPIRTRLETMWRRFAPLADPNFRAEFARDLNQRFWELYLGCCLCDLGFELVAPKSTGGPDFHIRLQSKDLWVEAVTPTAGVGIDAVPSRYGREGTAPVPMDKFVLRFTSANAAKCQKRDQYIAGGVIGLGDPFVIAVNGAGIWKAECNPPLPPIVQAVYGLGDYRIDYDHRTRQTIDHGYLPRQEVLKSSGAGVPTDLLVDPDWSGISGILYSDATCSSIPSELGREFKFVHHKHADSPLRIGWLGVGHTYFWQGDKIICKYL